LEVTICAQSQSTQNLLPTFLISIDDKHFLINFGKMVDDGTQFNNLPFIQIQNEQILRIALFPQMGR
jgi:hypothetical protein